MTFNTELHPGVCADAPAATRGFTLTHTMLRIKDPERTLDFYTRVLGMRVLRRVDFAEMKFTLYYLACPSGEPAPEDARERTRWMFSQCGVLEFTHNWGTENDPAFAYHNGNAQPQGYGHVCFAVPDLEAAVRWFDANEVKYVKRPEQGRMKDIAFIQDPDGYWIEIAQASRMGDMTKD